ncbi:YidH family protein [Pontibacter sp. H249]|uniref:YidH family protein n=1 Tax=Pontibacter sp. H249 TaxID=3133420 RepID=UPI0030BC8A04
MLNPDKEKIKKLKKKLKIQEKKNAEIRDQMATQRTIFANERTLMAYLRTAMTVTVGGFVAIKFSDDLYLEIIGSILIPFGIVLGIYSFIRYRNKQRLIEGHHQSYSPTSHEHAKAHNAEKSYNDGGNSI